MSDQPGPPPLPGQQPLPPLPDEGSRGATPRPGHAMLEQHQDTRTYPCTACGGELEFDIGQQRLQCPHCGNMQDLTEARGAVEEQDLRAALRNARQGKGTVSQLTGEKEVVCQNCGGRTTFTGTLTSTRCPYCTTPIQRDDVHDAPDRLPVDGVVPFRVDQRQAEEALQQWVSSRWFAPSEFSDYSRSGSFASVYTAYFTYDAVADTRYRGERGEHYQVEVGSGDDRRTETRTRWHDARGQVHNTFDDVAVLANDGLNRGHVAQLEPWPVEQVKPFSHEYVAGHLSRTYDHDVEECFEEARSRMESQIDRTVRRDIGGDEQRVHSKHTTWSGMTFKHLLLPIWLLTVTFEGQPYQVMINGVTGEVAGERPYSKAKIIAAVLAAIVVIAVVVFLLSR